MRTFTFGFDHKHPTTGESLSSHYIQVPGEDDLSRRFMLAVFGRNWSMQYKDPSKLKYLDRMTELKWSQGLLDLISADERDVLESVVGERLEVHFGLEKKTDQLIDEYFDTLKDLPPVETHTRTPVVEYAQHHAGGSMLVHYVSEATEKVYPVAKWIQHTMTYGGQVFRRRVLVIEDWMAVTEEEAAELWKQHCQLNPDELATKLERQTKLP